MIENQTGGNGPAALASATSQVPDPSCIQLDARNLEPPQPLLKTLEALATLPSGATLRLHTRWRPALLYAELQKRGFSAQSQDQPDGSCLTYIRRN
jgi:tRNA 2-thiouridine synthesizing protein A